VCPLVLVQRVSPEGKSRCVVLSMLHAPISCDRPTPNHNRLTRHLLLRNAPFATLMYMYSPSSPSTTHLAESVNPSTQPLALHHDPNPPTPVRLRLRPDLPPPTMNSSIKPPKPHSTKQKSPQASFIKATPQQGTTTRNPERLGQPG
jgi:hypothetical protein